jgi:hypothetical protein
MLLVLGLLCAVLILQRSWLGALALVLATLAFALRLGASENYWDYLIDPYLALYSLGALLSAGRREDGDRLIPGRPTGGRGPPPHGRVGAERARRWSRWARTANCG